MGSSENKKEDFMEINIKTQGEARCLKGHIGASLLDILRENHIYVPAYCNGLGQCGKCLVGLIKGHSEITKAEEQLISPTALSQGWRLACHVYPKEDLTIELPEEDGQVLVGAQGDLSVTKPVENEKIEAVGIAVDLGTTTISAAMVDLATGAIIARYHRMNGQRAYGADVISRINAATSGAGFMLKKIIGSNLIDGFKDMCLKAGVDGNQIQRIVISGNTTMTHLLLGYDCEGLGKYPFTPVNIKTHQFPFDQIFDSNMTEATVYILPGISAYVGADVVAGMLTCDFYDTKEPVILVDLGTNGEMALKTGDTIFATSAAAGPAFEGGNLSCGTGSVAGAICKVDIKQDHTFTCETIENQPPVGICGTGVIDAVAELVNHHLIDYTGLPSKPYMEDGFILGKTEKGKNICLTPKDIREFQMAKAAIAAAIDVLLDQGGCKPEEIKQVYIAGGFGTYLDVDKAAAIGLLPKCWSGIGTAVGNTSLGGAIACVKQPDNIKILEDMIHYSKEVILANEESFGQLYMDAMYFKKR